MLIISSGKVTVTPASSNNSKAGVCVKVEGEFEEHHGVIKEFFSRFGLEKCWVKRRFGRLVFSNNISEFNRQRIRNFFLNELRIS